MITIPNRTDMEDESLALRTIDENLRKLAEDILREQLQTTAEVNKIKKHKPIDGKDGEQGPPGIPGRDGLDGAPGTSTYFHIAYADSADGRDSFSNDNPEGRQYIGTYVDDKKEDSDKPEDYKWVLIKGASGKDGEKGVPGINGKDGKTSYLHIAYANSPDGRVDFDIGNSSGKLYIGQYVDFIKSDDTDPTRYKWTKIKGEQGKNGEQGPPGEKGNPGENGTPGRDGVSISGIYRWYYLGLTAPDKPVVKRLQKPWTLIEPTYENESVENLFYVDQTIFSDGAFYYSEVQVSSSYAAAKNAYNKAVENHENILKQLANLSRETKKEISDTAESITRKIQTEYYSSADMDDKIANIESQISQTDSSVDVKFRETLKNINDLKFDSDKKYSEILSTIRLDKNGISIGKSGNKISMNLDNNKLRFIQKGIEVAYMSNNKLYIQNAEVLSSIKLGKFAFMPDIETGSLSFGKVED